MLLAQELLTYRSSAVVTLVCEGWHFCSHSILCGVDFWHIFARYGLPCHRDDINRALTVLCADGAAINPAMCNDEQLRALYQWCAAHLLQKGVEDTVEADVVVSGTISKLRAAIQHIRVSSNRSFVATEYADR